MSQLSLEEAWEGECNKLKKTSLGNPICQAGFYSRSVVLKLEHTLESSGSLMKRDCWPLPPESLIQKLWSGP